MTCALTPRACAALLAALVVLTPAARADEEEIPKFKSRGDQEKKFVASVAKAVLKAAHGTGKDRAMERYTLEEVKKGRHKLTIKGSYKGAVTGKSYAADIVLHLDTSDKEAWEVLRIEYSDNNNIPHSRKKVEELVKQFNRKE
jgi:hypothetical protein